MISQISFSELIFEFHCWRFFLYVWFSRAFCMHC